MASSNDNVSMALFCDFENVALGVRDANYDKFDIKPVLERLLLKGSIVVKKAYCDWDRYKAFKAPMHEANFELIEIPHVRQSGKNSADIRMVVDALDLCYTKSHVDTFVIISGDSDFSPLVSKLRENAKKVIGVGVKQSTSDLLVANCDEFIFYDDLVRESRRAKRESSTETKPAVKRSPEEERARRDEMDKRRSQAVEIAVNTFEALVSERGDSGKIWASVLKEAIKRRKPDFSESYYGFRTFGNLIEECKARGHLEFGRDEKSGAYVYRGSGVPSALPGGAEAQAADNDAAAGEGQEARQQESRRSRGRGRTAAERFAERQAERLARQGAQPASSHDVEQQESMADGDAEQQVDAAPVESAPVAQQDGAHGDADRGRGRGRGNRGGRKQQGEQQRGEQQSHAAAEDAFDVPVVLEAAVELPVVEAAPVPAKKKSGAKPPARKLKTAAKGKGDGRNAKGGAVAADAVNGAGASAPALAPVESPRATPAPVAADAAPAAAGSPPPAAAPTPADASLAADAKPAKAKAAKPARPAKPKAAAKAAGTAADSAAGNSADNAADNAGDNAGNHAAAKTAAEKSAGKPAGKTSGKAGAKPAARTPRPAKAAKAAE
ncbi:NYN domain-containing protein [Duganella aceris]|uniref:NYN domain-containing protein n=1 Tax=Duganella aceris TaxID=2703883 RepID=A0ABX0FE54_9BURK|nr:NYN domain-containing protein [Duganella aceris]NGZ82928.1 NYN domain-containing protein [Duganella aceris]